MLLDGIVDQIVCRQCDGATLYSGNVEANGIMTVKWGEETLYVGTKVALDKGRQQFQYKAPSDNAVAAPTFKNQYQLKSSHCLICRNELFSNATFNAILVNPWS